MGAVQQHFQQHGKKWAGAGVGICCSFLVVWEGFAPRAVHERVDPPGVITWCFGRTNYDDPTVKAGTKFTKAECEKLLDEDLPKYAAPVQQCIPSFDTLKPNVQAALVSFAYNLGPGTLCKSAVARYVNQGKIAKACNAMMPYVRANGVVLRGLVNRRNAERKLCLQ